MANENICRREFFCEETANRGPRTRSDCEALLILAAAGIREERGRILTRRTKNFGDCVFRVNIAANASRAIGQ